jgi:hypothetical protein
MVANRNVSLTNYDAQLANAQRRQKLAEMLQEQANAPIDIQSYKGVQAPISWGAVLAKALQGGLAGYQGRKAQETLTGAQNEARSTAMTELMKPETVVSGGYNMADKAAPAVTTQRLVNALNQKSPMPSLVPGGDVPSTVRPMTGQESLNRAYGFGMSGNPILEAAAPAQIKKAQETVGVERFMSGLGPVHESIKTQLAPYALNGDLAGVQKAYGEITKPLNVGGTVQKLDLVSGEYKPLLDLREKWKQVDASTQTEAERKAVPPGQIMLISSNGNIKVLKTSDASSALKIQQDLEQNNAFKAPERAVAQAQLEVSRGQLGVTQAGLSLRQQEFDFAKSKGKVPPKILAGYNSNETAINQIDDAIKEIETNKGHLGLRNAAGDAVMQRLDPKGVGVRAKVANITAVKRHDLSGASVTYKETPYLAPFLPNLTDEDEVAISKLRQLKEQFVNSNSQIEVSYGAPSGSNASEGWGEAEKLSGTP